MGTDRLRQIRLGGLVVMLLAVIAKLWMPSAPASQTSNRPVSAVAPRAQQAGQQAQAGPSVVRLDALDRERPKPEASTRDLFRFKQKAPPLLAPIMLKSIGLVEAPTHGEKIAILSDGRNAPFYGREEAIIEGRYRILKLCGESVDLVSADGRGRQTIRLTGS